MEKSYRVIWEMDIDAESPRAAAERALEIHRNPESIANIFTVTDSDTGESEVVDLLEEDGE